MQFSIGDLVQFITNDRYITLKTWLIDGNRCGYAVMNAHWSYRGEILAKYRDQALGLVLLNYEQRLVGCLAEVIGYHNSRVVLYLISLNLYTYGFDPRCLVKVEYNGKSATA